MDLKEIVKQKCFKSNTLYPITEMAKHLKQKMLKESVSKDKIMDWYGYDYIDKEVEKSDVKFDDLTEKEQEVKIEINNDFYSKVREEMDKIKV